jgi:hypothetical protein
MKLLSICLFAAALLTFLSGCANQEVDENGYSPGQERARHSSFDPQHPNNY